MLIVDGEELVGAKQNRVANLTLLIEAKGTTIIPVSCVEAGRWSYRTPDFDVSDRVQNARGRAEKLKSVRHSIRERGSRRSDRGRVWNSIAEESASLDAESPTEAMGAMFDRHRETLDDYVAGIRADAGQVGAVVVVGGRHHGLDLFDRPADLRGVSPQAGSELRHRRPGRAQRQHRVRITTGTFDDYPAVGLGRDVGVVGERLVAGALVAERHGRPPDGVRGTG